MLPTLHTRPLSCTAGRLLQVALLLLLLCQSAPPAAAQPVVTYDQVSSLVTQAEFNAASPAQKLKLLVLVRNVEAITARALAQFNSLGLTDPADRAVFLAAVRDDGTRPLVTSTRPPCAAIHSAAEPQHGYVTSVAMKRGARNYQYRDSASHLAARQQGADGYYWSVDVVSTLDSALEPPPFDLL